MRIKNTDDKISTYEIAEILRIDQALDEDITSFRVTVANRCCFFAFFFGHDLERESVSKYLRSTNMTYPM